MMRPPKNYREIEKKSSDAKPVLFFIALAILIVTGLELAKSGQINFKMPELKALRGSEHIALIDPETLKEIHQTYMEEGVDITEFYSGSNSKAAMSLPAYRREKAKDIIITAKKEEEKIRSRTRNLDDILSDIAPAAGEDEEKESSAFDVRKDQFRRSLEKEQQEEPVDIIESAKKEEVLLVPDIVPEAEIETKIEEPIPAPKSEPKPAITDNGLKKIVIIIDDMGVNTGNSLKVENLQGPLTLSYLPYASNLPERTKKAKANGHELMVHMPMEPINGDLNGGPAVLKIGLEPEKFSEILEWGLSQFEGYAGLNNHMGSRLTQDRQAMKQLMEEIKKRGIYFVDSVTIASSIGAEIAEETGTPHAERDIFLDHEISKDFIRDALKKLEAVARYKGHAIAIGHPHDETIEVLKEWLPTLKDKGFELVPASAVIHGQEQDKIIAEN
ncbi:MAG: divergent polysaccharide deacetylase family protein [Alphaproteobacteria bacterium]|nr:divergent polysaccharide deacetylase family protein [Alphaproteobacteria bacterium]